MMGMKKRMKRGGKAMKKRVKQKMKMGGKFIYHKTVYDFHSLKSLLKNIGMKEIKKYNWEETSHSEFDDHSQAYLPHMDKENGTSMSLNVECKK